LPAQSTPSPEPSWKVVSPAPGDGQNLMTWCLLADIRSPKSLPDSGIATPKSKKWRENPRELHAKRVKFFHLALCAEKNLRISEQIARGTGFAKN
jgi:hypothetical protein